MVRYLCLSNFNLTGMNSKKNPKIGDLAKDIMIAIKQEKYINQDIQVIKYICNRLLNLCKLVP